MNKSKRIGRMALCLIVSFVMIMTLIPRLPAGMAFAAVGGPPPHAKKLTDNGDGTYTLSLDVTGESIKKPNNVNVTVILDVSGSMDTRTGGYGSQTRMAAAQNAVNSLATSLFAYNTSSAPDTVEMALVTFSTTATIAQQPTNSLTTFRTAVNRADPDGGTNWEDALHDAANVDFGDDDQTFVIFVSDGNPTFRNTRGNYNPMDNYYYNTYGVYGNGSDSQTVAGITAATTIARCYEHAVDDAQTLAQAVGTDNFFTIGAFGNVDRMQSLTTAAGAPSSHYYSASDTTALNQAISDILAKIEMSGFADVDIEDGTTQQVKSTSGEIAELLVVDENSYKYYRSGGTYGTTMTPWDDAPEAHLVNGVVEWDLTEEGVLENGVKYTVTFDCYPSQTTYDVIAGLKNGDITYGDTDVLPAEAWPYIVDNGGGSYSLLTNTNATLDFDDTRTENVDEDEVGYDNPPPVKTDAETLTATKEWEGEDADVDELDITVLMDGEPFHTATISKPDWSTESFISIGIIKNGQVLPGAEGHDFKFAELGGEQYHWELETPTVHPMLINGTKTMLIMVDDKHEAPSGADTYRINGKTYYADTSAAGLTAINHRRSNLNLTKVVTGEDAPEDTLFPFELTVNNSKAPKTAPSEEEDPNHDSDYWVWISIRDENGNRMTGLDLGEGVVEDGGGYYYAPSGTTFNLEIGAGWSIRFTNLPSGSTYTFAEGTLPEGFAFNKAELTQGEDSTFSGNQTTTGTIENTKTSYAVAYTNDYALTDLEITKKWEDADNQDGLRLTAAELKAKLTLSPTVEGKEPTVVDNEDGTYTITYTGLPRFNNGQEVEYTVTESAIDGYSTTGSPAKDHGTITNTHEPEVTEVTVKKVWDDNNDIGKIRPASVNVQLKADGEASGDAVALNEGNKWTYTWEELPKYKNGGTEIVYTADETAVPLGYDKKVEKSTAADGTITFTVTNTYNPTPVSVDPPVQKIITGNDSLYNKGDFTFTIAAVSPTDAPMPENTSITNVAANEVEGKTGFYEFGEITFTKPGEYTYKVTESGEVDGVTNDSEAATGKTLTFTVKDDGTGKLVVSPDTDSAQWSFTNVYNADGEASIVVTKEITGAAWPAGKTLTLTIAGTGSAPMPEETTATLNAAGSVTFGPIKYGLADAGKEYTYTITESSFGAGWSGSPESVTAKVKVTDNGDGTLKTEVTYTPEDAKFTNTYEAEGKATLEAIKELSGAAWPAGKSLTFTLAGTESAPMPAEGGETVTLTKAGTATFGEITYTEADAGKTYTYTISEDGFGDGWTGSGNITATVVVTDNGNGTLKTEVTYSPEDDTITNVYEAEGEAVLKAIKKIEGAGWPENGKITFTLAGEGGTLPETKTVSLTEPGTATFGAITYDESDAGKTYTYTITEDGFGDGWTGTPAKITAKVEVIDKGDGKLETKVTYDPEDATFTNTYKSSGKAELKAKKSLVGRDWLDGESYTFTLYDEDGTTVYDTKTFTSNSEVTFKAFEYDQDDMKDAQGNYVKTKTLTYKISETSTLPKGISKSADITATVVLTDDGEGHITAAITYSPESDTIVNTYDATGSVEIKATKELVGRDWLEDETFTFTLKDSKGATIESKDVSKADPVAEFTAINYTEEDAGKTFTYTIDETSSLPGGIAKSSAIIVTVEVADNGDGTLTATATYKNAADETTDVITNTYTADGSIELEATKELVGREWQEGETYTFTLKDAEGNVIDTQEVSSNTTVTFDEIEYTQADMVDEDGEYVTEKTYTYTIEETSELPDGVSNNGSITVTVTVTDNGDGTLTAVADYTNDDTIINTYVAAGDAVIKAKKALVGRAWQDGEKYTFTLTAKTEGAPMPKEGTTVDFTADGEKSFGTITYSEEDAGKTYQYTISETSTLPDGIAKSGDITATVKVTDNGDGTLKTEVTYDPNTDTITNTYTSSGKAELKAKKSLVGRDWLDGESYTFTLYDEDGTTVYDTKTFTSNTEATFKAFEYDQDDMKDAQGNYVTTKTLTYKISETSELPEGISKSGDITATVVLTDDGKGKITAEITYSPESDTIVNTYNASGSVDIEVKKALEGRDWIEGETYTFTLYDAEGTKIEDKTVSEDNLVAAFSTINYTEEDAGKTFTYTVKETSTLPGGISNSGDITVTVVVADNGDGTLTATATYTDAEKEENDTITNKYDSEGEVELEAIKDLEGREWQEGETYTFTLKDAEGNVIDEQTVNSNSKVTFDAIEYTEEDMVDDEGNYVTEKTYTYTIEETTTLPDGMTNSGVITATVTVTDDGEGNITAEVSYDKDDTIVNTYESKGEATLKAKKALAGRAWLDGEKYTFTLTAIDGAPMPKEGTTVDFTADGEKSFGTIKYTQEDMKGEDGKFLTEKTYKYTISETSTLPSGIAKSGDITATVVLKDDGKGNITATVTYDPDSDTIINTYTAEGSATLKAKKLLKGRAWMDSESYTFTLKDPNGTVVEEKTVTADGEITFAAIKYDESDAGKTYTYTITETGNSSANVTASDPIQAKVEVIDNGDGTLKTNVTYTPEDDTIINTYVPTPVNAQINVNKTIDGYVSSDKGSSDNVFEFTLYDKDGKQVGDKITITTKEGTGTASFAPIQYTEVGEYTYTVKETLGTAAGYTYSTIEYPVVVTVTDDPVNGKLDASVSYGDYTVTSGDETLLDVINEFDMTDVDVTLTLTKIIDDQSNSAPDGTFTFKLYKDSVSEENFVEEKTITTKGLTGSVDFSKLTFDKSGEYTYVVVEEAGDVNGFTYDITEHTYKIIIDDNFDAAILEVNEDSTLEAEITNIYKAKETSNILKVKKEINDTSGSAYETTFTFTLKDADGNKIDEVTVVGAEEGEFKAIEYDKAGTYEYTITEVAGDDKGYQYDTTEYKVTVTVEDQNGELVATSAYIDKTGESQTSLTVTNTYDPEDAKIVIQAEKKVDDKTGGAAGNPKTFTFELLDADGNVIETVSRVGGGTVTFSELTYSKVGEYNYTVREVAGDDKGYTYDTSEYPVTVTVTDPDKDGILKAAITVGDSVEFINPYEAEPTSAKIQVNKALAGRDLVEGEFTFKLEELVDGEAVEVGTATNTAKGKVTFDKIEYTMPGDYTYVVSEVVPEDTKGVLFDEGTIKVVVKVTDDGNGQLAAEVQYPDDKTFNNQYAPEGTYTPEVKKVLKGRDLKKNEFTFKMVGPDGKVYTAKNDADGNVVFDELEFGVDDIGETYTYTITEKKGNLKYVKYDDHEVTLTLTITDNGDGTLKIKADYDGKTTFTNKYKKPTPPKTGDTTQVLPYMMMFTVALLGLILVFRRRKAVRK